MVFNQEELLLNSLVIGGWLLSDSRCLLRPSWRFFLLKACQSGYGIPFLKCVGSIWALSK